MKRETTMVCGAHAASGGIRPPHPARLAHTLRTVITGVLLGLVSVTPLFAQEEEPPEQSVLAPLSARSLLLDVARAGDRLVAVGERGHILISNDRGATWTQVLVPTRSMLTGVFFLDPERGWAVGHDGVVLRTRNGGASWDRIRWAPEEENPLFDVWFSDENHGIAIGAYGTFLVTSDGGSTWAQRSISDSDYHLHRIVPARRDRMYIAAEAGQIYRSDDGGTSWIVLPSPYEGSFFGALPISGDSLLVFGLRGHMFRSDDAGLSWLPIETGTTAMLTDAIRLDDNTIVVTGLGGVVLVSSDGGRGFTLYQQPGRRGIQSLLDIGRGQILMAGEFGVKVTSLDELTHGFQSEKEEQRDDQ